MSPAYCTACDRPVDREHICPAVAPHRSRRGGKHRAPGRFDRIFDRIADTTSSFGSRSGAPTSVASSAGGPPPAARITPPTPTGAGPGRPRSPRSPLPVTRPTAAPGPTAVATRRYRLPVLELLGLSDTSELTISLPTTPAENLAIAVHSTTLLVAPPEVDSPPEEESPPLADEDWIGSARLADVRVDDAANDTGALIGRLWDASEDQLVLEEDWSPHEFGAEAPPERTRRAAWIIGGMATLIAAVAGIWILTGTSGQDLAGVRTEYAQAASDLAAAADAVGESVAPITDLRASGDDLAAATAALADLDQVARSIDVLLSGPVPNGPFQEIDPEIEPLRANLKTGAEHALDLEQRLSEVLTYRMLMDRAFVLPSLPFAITPDNLPSLGVELSLAIADTADSVAQLPQDEAFQAHRGRAEELSERLDSWQVEYLEALRNDDLETTSALLEEMETKISALRETLVNPLAKIDEWAQKELDYIAAALVRADDLLAVEAP